MSTALSIINFSANFVNTKDIADAFKRLYNFGIIRENSISNEKECLKLAQLSLPFCGILSLVSFAIYNLSANNVYLTYEDIKSNISRLEQLLPIADKLQITFKEELEDAEGYYYLVLQRLVQQQILDKQNPDKFSDWWDLAQEGT